MRYPLPVSKNAWHFVRHGDGMSAGAKLAAFAAVLAVLFGGGALAGAAIGPDARHPT